LFIIEGEAFNDIALQQLSYTEGGFSEGYRDDFTRKSLKTNALQV